MTQYRHQQPGEEAKSGNRCYDKFELIHEVLANSNGDSGRILFISKRRKRSDTDQSR